MTGSELAETKGADVPDLYRGSSAFDITAEDIAFPRMYIGQGLSNAVQDGLVGLGDIYIAQDADDADPTVLYKRGDPDEKGVVFHPLLLVKGKSRSIDGQLETWRWGDPDVPPDAWTTYTYFVTLDNDLANRDIAYRYLLTRSGKPAALKINGVLSELAGEAPSYTAAFRLTTAERFNKNKQRYFVPRVARVEPTEQGLKQAADLAELVEANRPKAFEAANTADEPAI